MLCIIYTILHWILYYIRPKISKYRYFRKGMRRHIDGMRNIEEEIPCFPISSVSPPLSLSDAAIFSIVYSLLYGQIYLSQNAHNHFCDKHLRNANSFHSTRGRQRYQLLDQNVYYNTTALVSICTAIKFCVWTTFMMIEWVTKERKYQHRHVIMKCSSNFGSNGSSIITMDCSIQTKIQ